MKLEFRSWEKFLQISNRKLYHGVYHFLPPCVQIKIQTSIQIPGLQSTNSIHYHKPKLPCTLAFYHGKLSRIHLRNRTRQGIYCQHPMVDVELTQTAFERSTVHSTTRLAPVATAIAALENTSSPRTRKLFFSPTSTRTQPMTPKIR